MDKKKIFLFAIALVIIVAAGLFFRSRSRLNDSNVNVPNTNTQNAVQPSNTNRAENAASNTNSASNNGQQGQSSNTNTNAPVPQSDVGVQERRASYINRPVTYTSENNRTYTIGIDESGIDGLVMSIKSGNEGRTGYYISAFFQYYWFSNKEKSAIPEEDGDYFLTGLFMDEGIKFGEDSGKSYALKWKDSVYGLGDKFVFTVRAVSIDKGTLLDIFQIVTEYDSAANTYRITKVRRADALSQSIVTKDEREEIVGLAVGFAKEFFERQLKDESGWEEIARSYAVAELVTTPYNYRIFEIGTNKQRRFNYWMGCFDHTFAVSIPIPTYGYVTVYVAKTGYVQDIKTDFAGMPQLDDYMAFAYGPINTRSKGTMMPPNYEPEETDSVLSLTR